MRLGTSSLTLLFVYTVELSGKKLAHSVPRGLNARDFVSFRGKKFMYRARRVPARVSHFTLQSPPRRDVTISLAHRDHRKSKFGLRHGIKLN